MKLTREEIDAERRNSYKVTATDTPGTPEWAWRNVSRLTRYWQSNTSDLSGMREIWDELCAAEVWKYIPTKEPYGSKAAMLEAEMGITPEQLHERMTASERIVFASKATTGEVLPRGNPALFANRQFADLETQPERAAAAGVSERTQRKLDRLARERPELLERVQAGLLSVHRAAVEAGFVKPPSLVEQAMRLVAKMTPEELATLRRLLRDA